MALEQSEFNIPKGSINRDEILSQLADGILDENEVQNIPKDEKEAQEYLAQNWVQKKGIPEQKKAGLLTQKNLSFLKDTPPLNAKSWLEANTYTNEVIKRQQEAGLLNPAELEELLAGDPRIAESKLRINVELKEQLEKGWLNQELADAIWQSPWRGNKELNCNRMAKQEVENRVEEGQISPEAAATLNAMHWYEVQAYLAESRQGFADKQLADDLYS